MSVNDRVRRAVDEALSQRNLEDCAGGTVSVIVKVDVAGCPRTLTVRTEKSVTVDSHANRRRMEAV